MRDRLLFAVLPYLGALAFIAGCVVQVTLRRRVRRNNVPTSNRGVFAIACRGAVAAVAIAHVLTLVFPDLVLRWDRQFVRLVFFEGTRLVAGGLLAAAMIRVLARVLRGAPDGTRSTVDVVAVTLLLITVTSGLAIAIVYRWASSWSAVILAPYLSSIVRFDPSTDLVTRLPVLVKLHVVSSMAILAILPFTRPARAIVGRLRRTVVEPVEAAFRSPNDAKT